MNVRQTFLAMLLGKVLGKKLLGVGPHFVREHVAGVFLDKGGKVFGYVSLGVGLGNFFDASARFPDGCAAVIFAEVQVQRARGGEGGDVRRVAVFVNARDEVGETMQQLGAVNARVGGQAAVADERAQARLPRADQPRVRGAHAVAVAASAFGLHFGT